MTHPEQAQVKTIAGVIVWLNEAFAAYQDKMQAKELDGLRKQANGTVLFLPSQEEYRM